MTGYTKLFQSILTSSVWGLPPEIKVVWITLLALSDRKGYVAASLPGVARMAGVPVEVCEEAIGIFEGPDPYSRSPEHDGRRIEKAEGGWRLLNHEKYRNTLSTDDRREYFRIKKREQRDRKRKELTVDSGKSMRQIAKESSPFEPSEGEEPQPQSQT